MYHSPARAQNSCGIFFIVLPDNFIEKSFVDLVGKPYVNFVDKPVGGKDAAGDTLVLLRITYEEYSIAFQQQGELHGDSYGTTLSHARKRDIYQCSG